MRITIQFRSFKVEATLMDTPTGKAIFDTLPVRSNVLTWGDEIYFGIPVRTGLEPGAKAEVSVGDLAYWPSMPAFCIFFGPTPASRNDRPVAASPVNVFGRIDNPDIEGLRSISDDEPVTIEKQ